MKIFERIKHECSVIESSMIIGWRYTCLLYIIRIKTILHINFYKDKVKEIDIIARFMREQFGMYVQKYKQLPAYELSSEIYQGPDQSPIWTCWLSVGEMPHLVKSCITQIRKMSNNHEVIIIDNDNIKNYVDLPEHIWRKYNEGKITTTHLTDFVRTAVLYKYGGLYLDITTYPIRPINEIFFSSDLYTMHYDDELNYIHISKRRWSSYMLGCRKGNLLMKAALDVFEEYWKRYDILVDYLLIDHTFSLLYDEIPSIKNMVDSIPTNNAKIWRMQHNLRNSCSAEEFEQLINDPNQDIYKLSYKSTIGIPLRTTNGQPTLLGRICGIEDNHLS